MALEPYTITTTYGPLGNPNIPGTAAYYAKTGTKSPMQQAIEKVLTQFETASAEAKAANLARKQEVLDIYSGMESMYAPEGDYGKSYLSDLQQQKVQDVGSAMQTDISRGLYGIQNYGQSWEKSVGISARAKLEDLRTEKLSSVLGQKASFLERIEEPYPDYSTIATLIMQAANTE